MATIGPRLQTSAERLDDRAFLRRLHRHLFHVEAKREALLVVGDERQGAFHIHGIWLDADENIYLAQFDHMVSKLTRMR